MDMPDPCGRSLAAAKLLARRPARLDGLVVGLLDNSKPNARALLEEVAAALRGRFGARDVRVWSKPGSSSGAAAAVLDEMAGACAVALTASAD
jgi:hypothetical protein